jgi:hypothetical protein
MAVDLFASRPQVQILWFVAALLAAILAILERERRTVRRSRPLLERERRPDRHSQRVLV